MSNQVPYNLFSKCYKDTRKKIVSVQVLGAFEAIKMLSMNEL